MKTKCLRCSSPAEGGSYCSRHKGTPISNPYRKRPIDRTAFYSSGRWRALKRVVLSEQPICRCCQMWGTTTAATDIDHIWPIAVAPELAYTKSNMQALCHGCHSRKTQQEQKGIVYDYTKNRTIRIDDGYLGFIRAP